MQKKKTREGLEKFFLEALFNKIFVLFVMFRNL